MYLITQTTLMRRPDGFELTMARMWSPPKPGFARREARCGPTVERLEEGARGRTSLVPPRVLTGCSDGVSTLVGTPCECSAHHRIEAGIPLRGRVRARLSVERPAGRAGPKARQGDGRSPERLGLARVRPERVHGLPVALRPRPVRGLRGPAPRGALRLPHRACTPRALRAADGAARQARDRRGPRRRRVRHRDQARAWRGEAGRGRSLDPGGARGDD